MVEVQALGVECNIACQYCYQNPMRDAGNEPDPYDLDAIKEAVIASGRPLALYGGEPLLMAKNDLEDLLAWGYERFGGSTMQSNGALIDDDHVRMFRDYKVRVGISVDGPGALNDARWVGSLERTRAATAKTEAAIDRLCAEKLPVSLIITAHRGNAAPDKLPILTDWLVGLAERGVWRARLHILEVESPEIAEKYALSTAENLALLQAFDDLRTRLPADFIDVFRDMKHSLMGNETNVGCVWRACDPYTTAAVRAIQGNGAITNCGRTNKAGVNFTKADRPGFERYIALYHTPQEYLGCRDCRFFLMCKGQCPGTAVDGDWRNRTDQCELWMTQFAALEQRALAAGMTPLSMHTRRREVEALMLRAWASGVNLSLEYALAQLGIDAAELTGGQEASL